MLLRLIIDMYVLMVSVLVCSTVKNNAFSSALRILGHPGKLY